MIPDCDEETERRTKSIIASTADARRTVKIVVCVHIARASKAISVQWPHMPIVLWPRHGGGHTRWPWRSPCYRWPKC